MTSGWSKAWTTAAFIKVLMAGSGGGWIGLPCHCPVWAMLIYIKLAADQITLE